MGRVMEKSCRDLHVWDEKLAENRINEFQLLVCTDAYEIKKTKHRLLDEEDSNWHFPDPTPSSDQTFTSLSRYSISSEREWGDPIHSSDHPPLGASIAFMATREKEKKRKAKAKDTGGKGDSPNEEHVYRATRGNSQCLVRDHKEVC